MTGPRVTTSYDCPPIPARNFDWSAWDDRYGADESIVGHGATEAEAVADFWEQWEEANDEDDERGDWLRDRAQDRRMGQ